MIPNTRVAARLEGREPVKDQGGCLSNPECSIFPIHHRQEQGTARDAGVPLPSFLQDGGEDTICEARVVVGRGIGWVAGRGLKCTTGRGIESLGLYNNLLDFCRVLQDSDLFFFEALGGSLVEF